MKTTHLTSATLKFSLHNLKTRQIADCIDINLNPQNMNYKTDKLAIPLIFQYFIQTQFLIPISSIPHNEPVLFVFLSGPLQNICSQLSPVNFSSI